MKIKEKASTNSVRRTKKKGENKKGLTAQL